MAVRVDSSPLIRCLGCRIQVRSVTRTLQYDVPSRTDESLRLYFRALPLISACSTRGSLILQQSAGGAACVWQPSTFRALKSFRDVQSCSRPELATHYAEQCPQLRGGHHDLYQFGVPSGMAALIAGLARVGRDNYSTFFGFDSFVGLPSEAAGVSKPAPGMWQPGQFSASHELSGEFRTRGDAATGAEVYLPRSNTSRPLTPERAELMQRRLVAGSTRGANAKRVQPLPAFTTSA